jgi:hypothetical protein
MNIRYIDFMVSDFRIESDSKLKNRQLKSRKERQGPRRRASVRRSVRRRALAKLLPPSAFDNLASPKITSGMPPNEHSDHLRKWNFDGVMGYDR